MCVPPEGVTNLVGDFEHTQFGYCPVSIIYSIPKLVGFNPWTIWLRGISYYHFCQLMLVSIVMSNVTNAEIVSVA